MAVIKSLLFTAVVGVIAHPASNHYEPGLTSSRASNIAIDRAARTGHVMRPHPDFDSAHAVSGKVADHPAERSFVNKGAPDFEAWLDYRQDMDGNSKDIEKRNGLTDDVDKSWQAYQNWLNKNAAEAKAYKEEWDAAKPKPAVKTGFLANWPTFQRIWKFWNTYHTEVLGPADYLQNSTDYGPGGSVGVELAPLEERNSHGIKSDTNAATPNAAHAVLRRAPEEMSLDEIRKQDKARTKFMQQQQCFEGQNLAKCKCDHPLKYSAIWEQMRDGTRKYDLKDEPNVYKRFARIMLATCKRFGTAKEEDRPLCLYALYADCEKPEEGLTYVEGPMADLLGKPVVTDGP